MSRAMGLDIGTKTIGVAMSDPMYWIAQPHTTVQRKTQEEDLQTLEQLIRDYEVSDIVVGLPFHMNHTKGSSADRSETFARLLEQRCSIPVFMQDERLSTVSAERVLTESGVKGRKKKKEHIDAVAATFILQTWLDRRAQS